MEHQKILYHSEVGYLTIVSDDHYIRKIEFGKGEPGPDIQQREDHPLLLQAETQHLEYLNGKRAEILRCRWRPVVHRSNKPSGMLCSGFRMVKRLLTDNWRK